jgi:hypothetical protein
VGWGQGWRVGDLAGVWSAPAARPPRLLQRPRVTPAEHARAAPAAQSPDARRPARAAACWPAPLRRTTCARWGCPLTVRDLFWMHWRRCWRRVRSGEYWVSPGPPRGFRPKGRRGAGGRGGAGAPEAAPPEMGGGTRGDPQAATTPSALPRLPPAPRTPRAPVGPAPPQRPRLLYTVPVHSNPRGAVLPLRRRRQLIAMAHRYGFEIIGGPGRPPYCAGFGSGCGRVKVQASHGCLGCARGRARPPTTFPSNADGKQACFPAIL